MPRYFFDLMGDSADDTGACFDTVEQARNAAVSFLGAYLADHPQFAHQGHWQVDVTDDRRRPLLHVIVATVDAPASRASIRVHPPAPRDETADL